MNTIISPSEKKNLYIVFIFLIFLVTLAFSTQFHDAFLVPKRFFLRGFTIILIMFWLFLQLKYGFRVPRIPIVLFTLVYFSLVFISTIASKSLLMSIPHTIDQFCFIFIFIIVVSYLDWSDAKKTTPFLLILGGTVALYSVIQHLGWDLIEWKQVDLVKNRSISTLGNPDFLSAFLTMVIPIAFCFAYSRKSSSAAYIALGFWGFLVMVEIGTYSRAGLLAMVSGMIITLAFLGWKVLIKEWKKSIAILLITAIALCGIALMQIWGKTSHSLVERISVVIKMTDINVLTRLYLWEVAIKLIQKNPIIGVGPNTFSISYLPYRYLEPVNIRHRIAMPESSHNLYLDIAMSSGIFALIAFLVIIGLIYYKSWLVLREKKNVIGGNYDVGAKDTWDDIAYLAGYIGGITSYLIHHLAGYPTLPDETLFWTFLGFCCLFIYGRREVLQQSSTLTIFTPIQSAIFIAAGTIAIVLLYFNVRITRADFYYNEARGYQEAISRVTEYKLKEECFVKSLELYDRAIQDNRYEPDYWRKRGTLLEEFALINIQKELNPRMVANAIKSYEIAISLNRYDPYLHADMGRICARWGLPEIAEQEYNKALTLDPFNVVIMTDLAWLYKSLKKPEKAEILLKKANEIYPEGSWTFGNLGKFYFEQGKYDEAKDYFNKALKIEPDITEYKDYLKKIEESRNKKE